MLKYLAKPLDQKGAELEQGQFLHPAQRRLLIEKLQTDLRAEHRRRIEIMLLADVGLSQAQICEELQCSRETARFWISMAQLGQAHNWSILPIGRPKTVNEQYLERLKELVGCSPRDYGYFFSNWTAEWLSKHLAKEFDIKVSDRHINRLLKKMGLSTRPKCADAQKSETSFTKESNIIVGSLHYTSLPNSSNLWPFNPKQT
jgi:transposase